MDLERITDEMYLEVRELVSASGGDQLSRCMEFFRIDQLDSTVKPADLMSDLCIEQFYGFGRLLSWLNHHSLMSNLTEKRQQNRSKMVYIMKGMLLARGLLIQHVEFRGLAEVKSEELVNEAFNLYQLAVPDCDQLTSFQILLLKITELFSKCGYHRYKGDVYEQIELVEARDPDGHMTYVQSKDFKANGSRTMDTAVRVFETHSWRRVGSIEEVILKMVDKNVDFDLWQNLTRAPGNSHACAELMSKMTDKDFTDLKPNRLIRSFLTGVLRMDGPREQFYNFQAGAVIPRAVVSCKFYNMRFDPSMLAFKHWYNIQTPALESILSFQLGNPTVIGTVYAQLGRLLYAVNHMDRWQVLLFIKGVANSGKSTIGRLVQKFFNTEDVAVMASNIESKFGLDAIADKMLFICFEVTKQFGVARSDFQSLISGEELQIAAKFKTARKVTWDVPGIMFGNELGPWMDSAGSIARRLLVVEFNKRVVKTDTNLEDKLDKELPEVIYKCQQAYMSTVYKVKDKGIWESVPAYFTKIRRKVANSTNPIKAFLNDRSLIARGEDNFMVLAAFGTYLKIYIQKQGYKFAAEPTQVLDVLQQEELEVLYNHTGEIDGREVTTTYIRGIKYIEGLDNEVGNDDYDEEKELAEDGRIAAAEFATLLPKESENILVSEFFSIFIVHPEILEKTIIVTGDSPSGPMGSMRPMRPINFMEAAAKPKPKVSKVSKRPNGAKGPKGPKGAKGNSDVSSSSTDVSSSSTGMVYLKQTDGDLEPFKIL